MTARKGRVGLLLLGAAALVMLLLVLMSRGSDVAEAAVEDESTVASESTRRGELGPALAPERPVVPSDATGTISGRITAVGGTPIAGADVCARPAVDDLSSDVLHEPQCTKSGRDGSYELTKLFRVRHAVSAAAREHIAATYGQHDSKFQGIRLDRLQHVRDIDIELEPGGAEVKGVVKDLSGGVIEGAIVYASEWANVRSWGPLTRTDADGNFTLWVDEGSIYLSARADGYATGGESGVAPGMLLSIMLEPESVVAGVVRDEAGKPVAGAKVVVGWEAQSISDDDGRYRIEGLRSGRYTPNASIEGADGQARESVLLGLGESAEDVDVFLYPAAHIKAQVVVASSKEPCESGFLRLEESKGGHSTGERVRDGVAEIDALAPGHYDVHVTCQGYASEDEYEALDVGTEAITDLVYTVRKGATLHGFVRDSADEPIKRANVTVNGQGRGGERLWATTDADGAFEVAGLQPGEYKLSVWAEDVPSPKEPVAFTVPDSGDPEPQTIVLELPATIVGTVADPSGQPLHDIEVRAKGADWESSHVKDDGSFELKGLRAGEYRVVATGAGWGSTLRSPGTGDDDVQGEVVTVGAGEQAEVRLVVEASDGVIEGIVEDEDGGPLADAHIALSRESESAVAVEGRAKQSARWTWGQEPILSDVDGHFVAKHLAPGSYTIRAYRKGGGEGFTEHVAVGSKDARVQIEVEGSLSGKVVMQGGGAPERFTIFVQQNGSQIRRESFHRTDGEWAVHDVSSGTYDITATANEGSVTLERLELAAGAELEGIELELEGKSTIRGRVVDLETGEPIEGVVVVAHNRHSGNYFSFGGKHGKEQTDADGNYVLENAPTGRLELWTMPANFMDWDATVPGSTFVDAEPGGEVDAPDILIPKKRVGRGEMAGDLGFKLEQHELEAEIGYYPHAVGFIRPGGPAAGSGLKVGDVIVKVDGHDVTGTRNGLFGGLTEVPEGTTVTLGLESGKSVSVTAGPPV